MLLIAVLSKENYEQMLKYSLAGDTKYTHTPKLSVPPKQEQKTDANSVRRILQKMSEPDLGQDTLNKNSDVSKAASVYFLGLSSEIRRIANADAE